LGVFVVDQRKVLWVLGTEELAGVGRHSLDMCSEGIPGWQPSFLVEPGPLADELRRVGAEVVESPSPFSKKAGTLSSFKVLRRAIRDCRPLIVHSHLSWADVQVAVAAGLAKIPVVTTEHGIADVAMLYHGSRIESEAKRQLHRMRLRHTDGLIAVSQATMRSVERQWGPLAVRVSRVQHNGADQLDPEKTPPRRGLRVGTLSRLSREKRLDLALQAFAEVHSHRPDASLTVAGVGSELEALKRLASSLGIASAVEFIGHVLPEVFFERVDIVVQVSWWENCSYTLLDAVRYRRGIVATDVGGNSEFLPASCLLGSVPTSAEVAAMILSQENLTHRLPPDWPTVAQMASEVARFYDEVIQVP